MAQASTLQVQTIGFDVEKFECITLNNKKSEIREGMIRLKEGKFFLCIMQSLIQDSGALNYHDLESTQYG